MSQKGHATGMAGEFHVMELLFRMGHEPALTLGNAKTIDILTRSSGGKRYEVSVKAMRSGGKWGVGSEDFSKERTLRFVLLHYKRFDVLDQLPDVWVIPATHVERIKRPWQGQYGIYLYEEHAPLLAPYKDAWQYLDVRLHKTQLSA